MLYAWREYVVKIVCMKERIIAADARLLDCATGIRCGLLVGICDVTTELDL
jgi:hypothetical protein